MHVRQYSRCNAGDIGHYYYGPGHPMKPHRLKLAHHLLLSYNLYREMDVYRPHLASSTVSWCAGRVWFGLVYWVRVWVRVEAGVGWGWIGFLDWGLGLRLGWGWGWASLV